MISTPKHKGIVWFLALVQLLSQPAVEKFFYETSFRRGAYPPEADSIGIPIAQFTVGWIITLPFILFFIRFALREYPGSVSMITRNADRPIWTIVWSVCFGVVVTCDLFFAAKSALTAYPVDVAHAVLSAYVGLCLRSSIVHSSAFMKTPDEADAS